MTIEAILFNFIQEQNYRRDLEKKYISVAFIDNLRQNYVV